MILLVEPLMDEFGISPSGRTPLWRAFRQFVAALIVAII
jgi:hypothetical protein